MVVIFKVTSDKTSQRRTKKDFKKVNYIKKEKNNKNKYLKKYETTKQN